MPLDFTTYNAPGVYTQSVPGPQIGVNSTAPRSVGIFGVSQGYRSDTETFAVPADDGSGNPVSTQNFRQTGIQSTSVVVRDPVANVTFVSGTDYTLSSVPGPSGIANGQDSTWSIKRIKTGALAAGTNIQLSYNYTNVKYFLPTTFYTYNDVVDMYGQPLDVNGNVVSELSFACLFAFKNGAQTIVAVAVNPSATPATTSDYQNALNQLTTDRTISVVVPATGNPAVHTAVQQHVDAQSLIKMERRGIVGRDGSQTPVSSATRISNANTLNDTRVAMVSPATFNFFNPNLNKLQVVGSQFVAAGLAAIVVSNSPAQPLTRKQIKGFVGPTEFVPETQRNTETVGGLMVLENNNQGNLRVRHGVTTNPSSLLTREWTITGQQDAMVYQLRSYLDADGLIGSIIDDLTMVNVKATASAALDNLVANDVILGYQNLMVRQLINQPDVIEISFEWQAALPLNYLVVRYSIDISTGSVAAVASTGTPVQF